MEPSASPKTYWSVIKSFRNNKKYPVFHQFFTKIDLLQISKKKPNCSILFLLSNVQSKITIVKLLLSCILKLIKSLSNITFTEKDIEKVVQSLDPNKAHGHDMISIRMLKICGKSIIKPLLIIYKKCLEKG